MITIPRKTESVIPISVSQTLDDSDTAVFILKSGSSVILQKKIIQNGDGLIIHLDASDIADIAVGYYRYSIVVTKSDETSFSFGGNAYIKDGGASGAFVRGGDVKCITYSIKLSDDGKTLMLTGSDGKTSGVEIDSFSNKKPNPYFGDVFKIL